jgi:hypothetical protein
MPKIVNARPNLLAGENLPAAPLQKRSLEKRARLKTAGLALFGENGYENTSVARSSQSAPSTSTSAPNASCSSR